MTVYVFLLQVLVSMCGVLLAAMLADQWDHLVKHVRRERDRRATAKVNQDRERRIR